MRYELLLLHDRILHRDAPVVAYTYWLCAQMARTQKNKATSGHLGMLKVQNSRAPV